METIKAAITALWNAIQNAIPVERWLAALGNVLKYLGFAFMIVAVLFTLVYVNDGEGISQTQRFVILLSLVALLILTVGVVLMLAARSGDLLYSPYERSLRQGRNYGTKAMAQTRREVILESTMDSQTALPPGPELPQVGGSR